MSLLPSSNLPDTLVEMEDFIIHGTIYLIMTWLFLWGHLFLRRNLRSREFVTVPLFAFCFGVLVEFAQSLLTDYRNFENSDILANGIGALVGALAFRVIFYPIYSKRKGA